MNIARSGHGVAVLHGFIFAVGGMSGPNELTETIEKYDPMLNIWTTVS